MDIQRLQGLQGLLRQYGGEALVVGGAVRDHVLGKRNKDIDIEVYGLDVDFLADLLREFGQVDAVGKSFGVLKVSCPDGQDLDVSLPRRDSKAGQGHRGFVVEPDSAMSPKEAAARRDFTFNALAQRQNGQVLDFFGGVRDLKAGVIRHTSEQFSEDPLRVLRGMQFAGRFNMVAAPETVEVCREIAPAYSELPLERIWGEFWKLAAKASVPSAGLRFLEDSGWIAHFPEVDDLRGCPQDPEWHPEGDVWQHTLHVADAAARVADREGLGQSDRAALVLAAICHDMGKPTCTVQSDSGRWVSPGHNDPARAASFLIRIGCPKKLAKRVQAMVREHMVHVSPLGDRGVRRLLNRIQIQEVASLKDVVRLIEADHSGRPPLPGGLPQSARDILDRADRLGGSRAVQPLLRGQDLIDLGFQQGPRIGRMLHQAFQAQLDGLVQTRDDALRHLGLI